MGVMKGDFRLYLNQQNFSKLLNEDISKQSIEFVSLMNIIINNIIKLIQIQNSRLVFDLQKQNLIDIPRLVLQVYLNVLHISANQYSLNINQAQPEQPQIMQKEYLDSSDQKPIIIEEEPENIKQDKLQEIKEDNQSEQQEIKTDNQNQQIMSIQVNKENQKSVNIESLYQNVESSEVVIQKEDVDPSPCPSSSSW
ncbi:unnamed protein product (macronuclear) [Paramecium tetraurelia]|uniref:Uncharacterized protein n=1 Tax=Paramecium tetraurelia TaxID=5888 RepID=A0DNP2_PARTE|nr:uncharacterized protein GSPATT00018855001 [Paramecium tetraurelia]CAK84659.1 unnamed protein product [Paramecium tetraurelia]|eukprot:XP_001452056.1 hypothetical protein (macronuclear) [Paramecium tetraurelia strain d4-2]